MIVYSYVINRLLRSEPEDATPMERHRWSAAGEALPALNMTTVVDSFWIHAMMHLFHLI